MSFVPRRRPVPVAPKAQPSEVKPVPVAQVTPLRRLLSATREKQKADAAREAALAELKLISSLDADIDSLVARREAAITRIDTTMREGLIKNVKGHGYVAALEESYTRQQRNIDPQKFRNAVDAKAFWGSITVEVAKAKQFLGEKELNEISDVVPAKSRGVLLTVKEVSEKKK